MSHVYVTSDWHIGHNGIMDNNIIEIKSGDECPYSPGWYFSDESQLLNGPYDCRQEAEYALGCYLKEMNKSIFGAMPRMVDPPSGWRYGFPKLWDPVKAPNLKDWFIAEGYPEEDIELAMTYSRYWSAE